MQRLPTLPSLNARRCLRLKNSALNPAACAVTLLRFTRARFTTSINTKSTLTCAWGLLLTLDIAFFGGDPDNLRISRYDLDISFFRVYENDKPAHLDNFLNWSKAGVKEGDLTFVSGHPGATGRLRTMAQMECLRDVEYPSRLATYKRRIDLLKKFASESDENARVAKEEIFGYENAQKAIGGYKTGLDDKELMAGKAETEAKLRAQYKKANSAAPIPGLKSKVQ